MILDNSFPEAIYDILSASEYKFDIKMYDEYLTPTLVPENAVWIYIKKQNTFFKMPNIKENNMNLIIYIMNNEIITLIKHAIKRIRAISAQYGVVVDINVLSNKNRKKTFTNIVGKYLEQKKTVNESCEEMQSYPYTKQELPQKQKIRHVNVSYSVAMDFFDKIYPKIKNQLDYLKDK